MTSILIQVVLVTRNVQIFRFTVMIRLVTNFLNLLVAG